MEQSVGTLRRLVGPVVRVVVALGVVASVFALGPVAPASAGNGPPPYEDCLAKGSFDLADCTRYGVSSGPDYGPINSVSTVEVPLGGTVTMSFDPGVSFTTPIQCGDLGCTYHSIAWRWNDGFIGMGGISLVSGCGATDITCTVRYSTQGVGDGGEDYNPVFVQHFAGRFPLSGKAIALYTAPDYYEVAVRAVDHDGEPVLLDNPAVAFAVRQGTNPDVADCLASGWIYPLPTAPPMRVPDCVRIENRWGDGYDNVWGGYGSGYLPNTGTWTIYPFDRNVTSGGTVASLPREYEPVTVTPAGDDIEATSTRLDRPTLQLTVTPTSPSMKRGTTQDVTVVATAVGGDVGSLTGLKFGGTNIIQEQTNALTVIGPPSPVPAAGGFDLARGASKTFVVGLRADQVGTGDGWVSLSGKTDLGRSVSAYQPFSVTITTETPPVTTTTLPTGEAPEPPVITSAVDAPGAAADIVTGTATGPANGNVTVKLASSAGTTCTKKMSGAGVTNLGTKLVTLDAQGTGSFTVTGTAITAGNWVYGTSTVGATTSAVSECRAVLTPPPPSMTTTTSVPITSSTTSTTVPVTTTSTSTPATTTSTTVPGSTTSTTPASTTSTTVPGSTTSTTVVGSTTTVVSPTTGPTTTAPPTTEAPTPTTVPPAPPASPQPTPEARLVTAFYRGLLHREPLPAELAFWAGRLSAGVPADRVSGAIAASSEFTREEVAAQFRALLDREPDASGLAWWVAAVRSGATIQDVRAALLSSPEAGRLGGGTDAGWLDLVYDVLLGRDVDDAGRAFWLGQLDGGTSRSAVAAWVVASPEAHRVQADRWYRRILGRAPTAAEAAAWADAIAGGVPERELVARLAATSG